jgi:hypothetical protein
MERNATEATMTPMVESEGTWDWQEERGWSQTVGFMLMHLAEIWFQKLLKVFAYNSIYK